MGGMKFKQEVGTTTKNLWLNWRYCDISVTSDLLIRWGRGDWGWLMSANPLGTSIISCVWLQIHLKGRKGIWEDSVFIPKHLGQISEVVFSSLTTQPPQGQGGPRWKPLPLVVIKGPDVAASKTAPASYNWGRGSPHRQQRNKSLQWTGGQTSVSFQLWEGNLLEKLSFGSKEEARNAIQRIVICPRITGSNLW